MATERNRRVVTAREVEDAAYGGVTEISLDPQGTLVTPLARERANDLGVTLKRTAAPSRADERAGRTGPDAGGAGEGEVENEVDSAVVAEALRRVRHRLGR